MRAAWDCRASSKYEIDDCPRIVILALSKDDRWLADWSLADGAITRPFDPVPAADTAGPSRRCRVASPVGRGRWLNRRR